MIYKKKILRALCSKKREILKKNPGATIIGEVSGFNVGRVSVLGPENKPIKLNDKGWDHFKL